MPPARRANVNFRKVSISSTGQLIEPSLRSLVAQQVERPPLDLTNVVEWLREFKEFDYVRFTYADIHGVSRCRVVAQAHVKQYLTGGVDIYTTGYFISMFQFLRLCK